MNQASFPFAFGRRAESAARRPESRPSVRPPAGVPVGADPADALGFDHARFGLVPPAACLWPGHPVREGWERGRRLVGRRARPATLAVRRWLDLRLRAWSAGAAFDDHQITPQVLRSLESATRCPITDLPLGEEAQVVAVAAERGWVAGNLALVSPAVAAVWSSLDWHGAVAALRQAEADPPAPVQALPLRAWRRIVALKSLATPLPDGEVMRIGLVVLPPNRLRLVNPLQELQTVLTLQLAQPGWGARARLVADALPLSLRGEFNLFFNSLLAQALRHQPGAEPCALREALALAWEDPVVLRRWGRFAGLVDGVLARTLVDRLAREGLPGLHLVRHEDERLAA